MISFLLLYFIIRKSNWNKSLKFVRRRTYIELPNCDEFTCSKEDCICVLLHAWIINRRNICNYCGEKLIVTWILPDRKWNFLTPQVFLCFSPMNFSNLVGIISFIINKLYWMSVVHAVKTSIYPLRKRPGRISCCDKILQIVI